MTATTPMPGDVGADPHGHTPADLPDGATPPDPIIIEEDMPRTWPDRLRSWSRLAAALVGAIGIFSAFLVARGADPIVVFEAMWTSAFGDANKLGETLIRATPLLLAALAVAVPAKAGLFNIGGEGQLVLGAIGAVLVAYSLGEETNGVLTLTLMAVGGAVAGGLWAAIPALLKYFTDTSEAIVSLLLNYVAVIVLAWLVFEPLKDPMSTGQAYSRPLAANQNLPIIWGNRVHLGVVIAVVAAVAVWLALRGTRWGFALKVLGGNPEAARRAGLKVGLLGFSALAIGGALAGLGGMLHVSGLENRLRPDLMVGYGYIGFLAAWLARHDPLKSIGAAVLLGAIAVGGTGLKISAGLSGAAVNVLMALVLLAVLGWSRPAPKALR
ncbi:MAG: ABC transporter permease [Acidimicrobiia bacterium]|nr:ABC transporter permease [Acidimicrobiia bacterium]